MKSKNQLIKELNEKIEKQDNMIKYQENVIKEYKKCILANQLFREEILAHEAPVKFVQYRARNTSYLIFKDGHYTKVKLAKGDKYNAEIALMYLLVKNSYNMDKLKELILNKKDLKVGESLPININSKKQ